KWTSGVEQDTHRARIHHRRGMIRGNNVGPPIKIEITGRDEVRLRSRGKSIRRLQRLKDATAVVQENANAAAIVGVSYRNILSPIEIEISHCYGIGVPTRAIQSACRWKSAIAIINQDTNVIVAALVGCDDVELAIAVEISGCEVKRIGAD